MTPHPVVGMVAVAGTLGGLLYGLRVLQTQFKPHPEIVRKLMHVVMGLVTLNMVWLFDRAWPVVMLAAITMLALFTLRRSKLKGEVGQVLHGVARDSQGELYFPLAVATVFVLADGNAVLFCLPVLILAVADATAALIGLRYGMSRYRAAEGEKSLEGSVAFFMVTFNAVLLTLLVFTRVDRVDSILIAFMLGLLVMMLEAIAWRGLDNLFIPLAGYQLLSTYFTMARPELLLNLAVILALLIFVILWRKRTVMDPGAVMAAALVGYLVWATGGWRFVVAPLSLFLSFTVFLSAEQLAPDNQERFSVYAVVSANGPGLVWLLLANGLDAPELLYPYTVFFAIYLTIVGLTRLRYVRIGEEAISTANHRGEGRLRLPSRDTPLNGRDREWNRRVLLESVVLGWLLLFAPYLLFNFSTVNLGLAGLALAVVAGAAWVFYLVQPRIVYTPGDAQRWVWQSAVAGAASAVGVLPLLYLYNRNPWVSDMLRWLGGEATADTLALISRFHLSLFIF